MKVARSKVKEVVDFVGGGILIIGWFLMSYVLLVIFG